MDFYSNKQYPPTERGSKNKFFSSKWSHLLGVVRSSLLGRVLCKQCGT